MPNRNYDRGRAAEYRARTTLEAAGYTVVRSSGSRGPADLVAWNAQGFRLVQVKRGRDGISPLDRETFAQLPVPPGTLKEVWRYREARKPPIVEVL